ncbi:uncharacterized protein LOC121057155 isoform X1 [Cygnus olor]|uniref:uncharacterized protein LOC121057155 isoform X1 n=1 Tax=Cygnus olor TaxID=8869 RepID=UPI001ADE81EB|nr:uncharacterized protein LOC121057155 isoform X1 [Cygnus olor]
MNSPTLDFITGSLKLFHVNKRIGRDVNLLHLFSFVPTPLCPPCVSMLDGTGRHNTTESEESWDLYKALRKAWPGNLQVAALSLLSSKQQAKYHLKKKKKKSPIKKRAAFCRRWPVYFSFGSWPPQAHTGLCVSLPRPPRNSRREKLAVPWMASLRGEVGCRGGGRARGDGLNRVPFSILFRLGSAQRGDFLIRAARSRRPVAPDPCSAFLSFTREVVVPYFLSSNIRAVCGDFNGRKGHVI